MCAAPTGSPGSSTGARDVTEARGGEEGTFRGQSGLGPAFDLRLGDKVEGGGGFALVGTEEGWEGVHGWGF